ncbi:DUF2163 domain-containing protein [Luteithermobacter gelatinilyticus]|uniref:DUF2163 domain-containing protein n=1 Tax=Luteithermobacter gelatinilyticus TaxID=2582913 RepID=UPI0011062A8C|nr:DUF2163 domain-containing protein [Luteithermobacter gelatinilyticus]
MKTLSQDLKAHLQQDLLTLCWCWRLVRRDGISLGFTTHDRPVIHDHFTYQPVDGFLPSAVSSSHGLNVDNLEVSAVVSSGAIRREDILAGRYDHARVEVFQLNWAAPEQGRIRHRSGWVGEVSVEDHHFIAEIRGLTQKLQQKIGEICSPECRAELGGPRCHVDLARFTRTGQASAVTDRQTFSEAAAPEADGWFTYGLLRWITGANAGLVREVKSYAGGSYQLYDPLPDDIRTGDVFKVQAGCDKRAATCRNKFNNFVNFRGEPRLPGHDSLYYYPGLK